ncbi:hypothetical protein BJV78DRAFT_1363456 [Lactifluus subvellereus]|nr:hypothetical protein BJV78DRAFT_1363456 [Lactifluus subvellereus]
MRSPTSTRLSPTQITVRWLGSSIAPFVSVNKLQRRLEARAAERGTVNWLADWWNEVAYMAYRDPVVVNMSYFYVYVTDQAVRDAPRRAATLVKATLPFRTLVETHRRHLSAQLEPEKVRDVPLCMDSYKWLFHASRYPTIPSDIARKFGPATHNHVVFIRNNRFFEVQLARPDGTEQSAADLEIAIADIIHQADAHNGIAFGALTSENRDTRTHARQRLIEASPTNEAALKRIESAMIVVALDTAKSASREDLSWGAWVGDGRIRWYDKHQLIVWDNGRSGFLGKHSWMDATPTLRLNEFMLGSLDAKKINLDPPTPSPPPTLPREVIPTANDAVLADIKQAEKNFDELVGARTSFAVAGCVGTACEAARVPQIEGTAGITYEIAQTRKFQRGRTEVIRAASSESKVRVDAMVDPEATDEQRAALFRRAAARHVHYASWAADGQGVDRHLFGPKEMINDGEALPEIYPWNASSSLLSPHT